MKHKGYNLHFHKYSYLLAFLLVGYFVLHGSVSHAQLRVSYLDKAKNEIRKNNYVGAIEYLNYAIKQNDYFTSYFLRGVAKYNLGDYLGAENDYTECIQRAPFHEDALLYRAISRDRQFDFERALQDYKKAQELDSTDWRIYLNRSTLNLFLQNFELVIEDCNKALELKSKGEGAYVIRGMARTQLKEYDEALADFEKAIKRNPGNNFTRIQRGVCYMEMGSYEKALAEFDWVLEIDSLNTRALFQRALLRMNNKEAFSAILDFDKIIELSPDNVSAIFNRAIAKSQLEDYAGAIEDYDLIIETNDDNMLAYYNRAGAKSNRGDLDGAILDYTKVIDLCPDFADAYYARSMVEKKKDNNRNAEKDYLLADSLSQALSLMDDSLSTKNAFKLLKMVTLSGEMSDGKKEEGMIQYKHVDILVKPYFLIAPFPQSDLKATYYDATNKKHYGWKLVELIRASDSIPANRVQQEIDSLDITTREQNSGIAYLVRRATLYTYQENFNKAFSDFDMAIALDTNNLLGYFGRANARLKLKELITDFEPQTTTLAGESMNTGVAGSYSGLPYAEIIADYNKVIQLDKDFPYAYYNSSYAQCLAGEYDEAIKNLSKTIELKPAFADAWFNRGITYLYLKNTDQACPDLSKAAELGIVDAYNIIMRYCNR